MLNGIRDFAESITDMVHGCFTTDIGIDLGTCNTLVCVRNKGIVLREPSVVAINRDTGEVINGGTAVGSVACEMIGKTPGSIKAIRPLKHGVISDFHVTEAMLEYFIKKAQPSRLSALSGPRVVIAVPSEITDVERRAVIESAERAGARKVYLVDEPMAAGIGAGLPIADPTASMIIDIGGGTTEIAIMSLADIASCKSEKVGGDAMDDAIVGHLKKTYNLLIGDASAERVKIAIGSAAKLEQEMTMEVAGRDSIVGLPRKVIITSEEIRHTLQEPVGQIIDAVIVTLEQAEPELAADLIENGIHLCGGGCLLRGMDTVISNATGLTVTRVSEPLESVARGTSTYIDNMEMWKNSIDRHEYV